ncbi:MAG: hypothetical protein L3J35_05470 [Bacteroidales bacterium]|nr:hypothetical protein [Bacteroidales bacterium]
MDTNQIIIAVVAVVLLILIIKFAKKVIKFVLITVLVVGLGIYAFLFLNGINSIDDLHNKYCENLSERNDSLKCVCIVQPIEDDFKSRFTQEEMDEMNSIKFTAELSLSLVKKSKVIKAKLKENNALNLLDEFKKDFLKK